MRGDKYILTNSSSSVSSKREEAGYSSGETGLVHRPFPSPNVGVCSLRLYGKRKRKPGALSNQVVQNGKHLKEIIELEVGRQFSVQVGASAVVVGTNELSSLSGPGVWADRKGGGGSNCL